MAHMSGSISNVKTQESIYHEFNSYLKREYPTFIVFIHMKSVSEFNLNIFRIALCNSGGIRAAFDKGNVTMEDILTTFPFSNTFDVVSLKGRYIREALEHSVDKFTNKNPNAWGGFLHVSGLQVVYNLDKNDGDRVVSLTVGDGKDLEDEQKYNIVTSNYVLGGGDGYTMISENYESKVIGDLDTDVMKYEFSHFSPVSAKIEGRIKFEDQTNYATPLKIDLLVGIAYGILALL